MKQTYEKITEDFGKACYKNDVVGLCITLNEKNNTNAISANASGYEAGFLIRQMIERLAEIYSDSAEDYEKFFAELLNLDLKKKLKED